MGRMNRGRKEVGKGGGNDGWKEGNTERTKEERGGGGGKDKWLDGGKGGTE